MEREEDLAITKQFEVFDIGKVLINKLSAIGGVDQFEEFRRGHFAQIGALDDQFVIGIVRLDTLPNVQDAFRILSTEPALCVERRQDVGSRSNCPVLFPRWSGERIDKTQVKWGVSIHWYREDVRHCAFAPMGQRVNSLNFSRRREIVHPAWDVLEFPRPDGFDDLNRRVDPRYRGHVVVPLISIYE